jgi:hypothetical protein
MPKYENWSRIDEKELVDLTEESMENTEGLYRDSDEYLEYKKGWRNDDFPFVRVYIYYSNKYEEWDGTLNILGSRASTQKDLHGFETKREADDEVKDYIKKRGGKYNPLPYVKLPNEFEIGRDKYKVVQLTDEGFRDVEGRGSLRLDNVSSSTIVIPRRCKNILEDFLTIHQIRKVMETESYSVSKENLESMVKDERGLNRFEEDTTFDRLLRALRRQVHFFNRGQSSRYYEVSSAQLTRVNGFIRDNSQDGGRL